MSSSNVDKVRMRVFGIWILTLLVVLAVFVRRRFDVPTHPFSVFMENLQVIAALVLPQLSIMSAFYLGAHKEHLETLSAGQIKVISAFSVVYHAIFITCLIYGVWFLGFETTTDGNRFSNNVIAVVKIMGIFSVLLGPVAFLFSRSGRNQSASG